MRDYIWLSYPLSMMTPLYGGSSGLQIKQGKSIANGDSCNTSLWCSPNHIGTHVDVPRHFFEEGDSVETYGAGFWVFESVCVVPVAITGQRLLIEPEQILPLIKGKPDLLLIKTGMGQLREERRYWEFNPGLRPSLARELRSQHQTLRAVGIDSVSVSSWQHRLEGRDAHRGFLNPDEPGSPIILVEDMDLSGITAETSIVRVIVLPLRVEGGDGAPCTVIAEVKE